MFQYSKMKTNQFGTLRRQSLLLQRWLRKELYYPQFFETKIKKMAIKKVLIYGAGVIGQQIYYALDQSEIEVIGFIDRTVKEVGMSIPTYKIEEKIPEADAVIVSIIYNQKRAINAIHQYTNIECIVLIDQIV